MNAASASHFTPLLFAAIKDDAKSVASLLGAHADVNYALPSGAKVLLFAHGHLLRVLAARWLGQSPTSGRFFMLGTATLSVLGWERGGAAVERWNVPAGPAPGSGPGPQ